MARWARYLFTLSKYSLLVLVQGIWNGFLYLDDFFDGSSGNKGLPDDDFRSYMAVHEGNKFFFFREVGIEFHF